MFFSISTRLAGLKLIDQNYQDYRQEYDGFPRFGQKPGVCPYKLEKNPVFFLESDEKHRNFASVIDTSRFARRRNKK